MSTIKLSDILMHSVLVKININLKHLINSVDSMLLKFLACCYDTCEERYLFSHNKIQAFKPNDKNSAASYCHQNTKFC